MLKESKQVGVSFTLPDRLTVEQLDIYHQRLADNIIVYKGQTLTTVRYHAIVYASAVEAGLIADWQCAAMPDLRPEDVGAADAQAIYFVGREVEAYVKSFTDIPPN